MFAEVDNEVEYCSFKNGVLQFLKSFLCDYFLALY